MDFMGRWVRAVAEAGYALLLWFFPRPFRRDVGGDVRMAFRKGCRRALDRGGLRGLLGYATRGYLDVVREGLAERRSGGGRAASPRRWASSRAVDPFLQDLRFGIRTLRRRPVFAGVALVTLALGIGAATAIFSVVNGVLLKPLPYPDASQLVVLWNTNPEQGREQFRMGAPDLFEVERSVEAFSGVTMVAGDAANFTEEGIPPLRVSGARVSGGFFQVLGVEPFQGRVFRMEEHQGDHRVVILSHGLWMGRFGGDPDIVGRSITMDGVSVQVVGVMPAGPMPVGGSTLELVGPEAAAYWIPLDYTLDWVTGTGAHVMVGIARLDQGVGLSRAREEVSALADALVSRGRGSAGQGIMLRSLKDQVVGDVRRNLVVLMTAVGLLLLMACGNVANLLLARSREREGEVSIRAALGANRSRLMTQIFTEAGLLGVLGGGLGLIFAWWGSGAMVDRLPSHLPRQSQIGVDGTVLLFALAAAFLAMSLAVLVPALRFAARDPAQGLKARGRGGSPGPERNRVNRVIVVAELSLATVLLFGAGLLFRSLRTLEGVDPGFRKEGVITAQLMLPDTRYGTPGDLTMMYDQLEARVETLPGVTHAAFAMDHPLETTWWNGIQLLDSPVPDPDQDPIATFRPVSGGYFSTTGIPVLEGRSFGPEDRFGGHPVAVVNQSFSRSFFPGRSALGERIEFTVGRRIWGPDAPTVFEVVGVVGDVHFNGLRESPEPAFYLPLHQFPYQSVRVMARTTGDASALAGALEEEVWAVDPDLPVTEVRTLDQLFAAETAQDRFNVLLLQAFSLTALLLAAAGTYGVLNLAVTQRKSEIGIRMALGSERRSVVAMVVKEAGVLAAGGLGVGMAVALALSRYLGSLLFQVPAHDLWVMAGVALTLTLVALGSGLIPALHAARTDPVRVLRGE